MKTLLSILSLLLVVGYSEKSISQIAPEETVEEVIRSIDLLQFAYYSECLLDWRPGKRLVGTFEDELEACAGDRQIVFQSFKDNITHLSPPCISYLSGLLIKNRVRYGGYRSKFTDFLAESEQDEAVATALRNSIDGFSGFLEEEMLRCEARNNPENNDLELDR